MAGTFSNILLHIVFSTKRREQLITPSLRERLYPFIGGIIRDERGSLLGVGGMPDHIHLLVRWRTDAGVSDLVRHVKSRSTQWIHEAFADHADFGWQEGYGVFSVSESEKATVLNYISSQESHHADRSFQDEYVAFLKLNHIPFEPQYVFD